MPPARTILFALMLATPASVRAQAPEFLAPTDTLYFTESRSALVSAFLEFSVPMLGYAWAGNWKRGLLPNTVRIGGVALMLAGWTGDDGTLAATGIVAAVTGTVWAVVGAGVTAAERGSRPVYRRAGFTMTPLPGQRLGFGYQVRR